MYAGRVDFMHPSSQASSVHEARAETIREALVSKAISLTIVSAGRLFGNLGLVSVSFCTLAPTFEYRDETCHSQGSLRIRTGRAFAPPREAIRSISPLDGMKKGALT